MLRADRGGCNGAQKIRRVLNASFPRARALEHKNVHIIPIPTPVIPYEAQPPRLLLQKRHDNAARNEPIIWCRHTRIAGAEHLRSVGFRCTWTEWIIKGPAWVIFSSHQYSDKSRPWPDRCSLELPQLCDWLLKCPITERRWLWGAHASQSCRGRRGLSEYWWIKS